MKKAFMTLALGSCLLSAWPSLAAEPSLHQIYETANAGQLEEAQRMMRTVLETHPNSGKAHYVEAELLSRQGKWQEASRELSKAEQLAPGLPFASEQSQRELRRSLHPETPLDGGMRTSLHNQKPAVDQIAAGTSNTPFNILAMGLALIAFIYLASRWMSRRLALPANANAPSGPVNERWGQGPGINNHAIGDSGGYPGPIGPSTYSVQPEHGGSLGGRIVGGLATGAALGAGIAASETLVHRWLDKHGDSGSPSEQNPQNTEHGLRGFESLDPFPTSKLEQDAGERDFGLSDDAGWDSDSGNDWR